LTEARTGQMVDAASRQKGCPMASKLQKSWQTNTKLVTSLRRV